MDIAKLQTSKAQIERAICQKSFYQFIQRFWDVVIKADPVWNWHIKYIADELQIVAERVFLGLPKLYDVDINVPPGSTKTTICSIMYPAWIWTRMPSARVIGASYAHTVAMDNSRKSRLIIESAKYRELFPEVQIRDDQNTKGFYETNQGGDRIAVGAEGAITGRHGHFLLTDDPINPREARSETEIKNVNTWMGETLATRKVDKKVSVMILIMQRLHQNDPTGVSLENADESNPVKHICLPADDSYPIKPLKLKRKYVQGLLDPVRIPKEVLEKEKKILGPYGYAGQYGQQPVPLGGGMFKFEKVQLVPKPRTFRRIVRYWDKAGTKDGGAHTAGVKIGETDEGSFHIIDVVRGQWDSGEREKIIEQTALADGHGVIIGLEQEPGSGGKESAYNTAKRLRGFTVMIDKVTGDKVTRADPFSVQVNIGNVTATQGAGWWPDYRNEMQFFPFSKYKDQIDASSGAFALLNAVRIRLGAL